MSILRPFLMPTVGLPEPVIATRSRRRRTMLNPEFYDTQPQQPIQPIQPEPQQTQPQQNNSFTVEPQTQGFVEEQIQRFRDRAAPPVLEPGVRVKSANMELVQPSTYESFYKSLGTIGQIGQEQLGAAQAVAASKRLKSLQDIMGQSVPGPNGMTYYPSGNEGPGAIGSGLGIYEGDINKLRGGARGTPASAYQGSVGRGPQWTGGGNLNTWISAATAILQGHGHRLSPSDIDAIKIIVKHESGAGSPNLQNNWDSNARKGIPSRGLMQTIQPTFDNNRIPGYDDVWNPIHNIVAAVRYSIRRYGSLNNVPGVRSIRAGKGYRPY